MTRRDLPPTLLFCTLAVLWAYGVAKTDRLLLPRHPSAAPPGAPAEAPIPYGAAGAAEAALAEPFNWWMTDPYNLLDPDLAYAGRALAEGRGPWWNSDLLCGVPHAANPITATFYPPTWIAAAVAPTAAPLLLAALHLALAASFFFAWMRALAVGRAAATLGAGAFALSGWMTGRLFNFVVVDVVVWLPLGLCGLERILRGRRVAGAIALGLAVGMMFLAGFPQLAVLGTLALGAYALAGLFAAAVSTPRASLGGGVAALLGVLLGALLAAPLLVPAAKLKATSQRGREGVSASAGKAMPCGALLGLVAPRVFGGPYEKPVELSPGGDDDHAKRHQAARLVLGAVGADGVARLDDAPSGGERAIYPGALVLLLIPFAFSRRFLRPALTLILIAVVGWLYATRTLVPPRGVAAALGLDVGDPLRGVVVFAFVPAALFAFAADGLFASSGVRLLRAWGALVVVPLVVVAVAVLVARDAAFEGLVDFLRDRGAERRLGLSASITTAQGVEALRPALENLRGDLWRLAACALAGWIALEVARRKPTLAALALGAILAADLGSMFAEWVRPVRAKDPYPTTPALTFLRDRLGDQRFARVSATAAEARAEVHRLFPPNCGLMHGLKDAQGYREPAPARTLEWFHGLSSYVATAGTAGFPLDAAGSTALDLAGVKYFVASRRLEDAQDFAASGLRRVPIAPEIPGDLTVYENPDALPRAFVARHVEDARPTSRPATEEALIAVARDRPEEAEFRVTSAGGRLVWTEAWDEGWRCSIDGGPQHAPAIAYGLFQSVEIPTGAHVVRFLYRPAGWREAGRAAPWVAGGAAFLVAAAVAFGRRRRTTRTTTSSPERAA
jgi:hypothetical protein